MGIVFTAVAGVRLARPAGGVRRVCVAGENRHVLDGRCRDGEKGLAGLCSFRDRRHGNWRRVRGEPETGRFFRTGHFGIEYGVIGNLGRVRDYLVRHFGRQYGDRRFHDGDAPDPDEYLGRDQDGRPPVR